MTSAKEKEPVFLPFFNSLYFMDYVWRLFFSKWLASLFSIYLGIWCLFYFIGSYIFLYISIFICLSCKHDCTIFVSQVGYQLASQLERVASYIRQSARTGEKYHGQQELGSQLVSQLAIIHFRPISDLTMNLELDLAQGLPPTRQFTENYCGIQLQVYQFSDTKKDYYVAIASYLTCYQNKFSWFTHLAHRW